MVEQAPAPLPPSGPRREEGKKAKKKRKEVKRSRFRHTYVFFVLSLLACLPSFGNCFEKVIRGGERGGG
jgi:hypothetical protein